MKIALAQQNYHIGDFDYNVAKICAGIAEARKLGAELVVFPELSVCGYPPRDFLEFRDFIARSRQGLETVAAASSGLGVIVGAPVSNPGKGKPLLNAAVWIEDGRIVGIAAKSLLPTYDIFDEYRYFEPASVWQVFNFRGKRLALTVCEDLWNMAPEPLYPAAPLDRLIEQRPDLIVNISASPFDYDHDEHRKQVLLANVHRYGLPLVYCNTVGAQTEIVFDGGSLVFDGKGKILAELRYFEEELRIVDLDLSDGAVAAEPLQRNRPEHAYPEVPEQPEQLLAYLKQPKRVERIAAALCLGIRDYFRKMSFTRAIIGSSGGIDSAVTLALACEALGPENVQALLMPSTYSSEHSVADAVKLSENLGNPFEMLPISKVYEAFLDTLRPRFADLPFNLTEENIQSRSRGVLLMAWANKFGYILLNTSNKSELSTGYGTLYGDMAGGLSVLGDVYKVQVYALAEWLNRNGDIIPRHILTKAPSAELRPDQKDSDSLPPYPVLDPLLYLYIEKRLGPRELVDLGWDESLVQRVLRLVNTSEYKRNQFCPIIRVSGKAFGVGRRMPIVGKYLS